MFLARHIPPPARSRMHWTRPHLPQIDAVRFEPENPVPSETCHAPPPANPPRLTPVCRPAPQGQAATRSVSLVPRGFPSISPSGGLGGGFFPVLLRHPGVSQVGDVNRMGKLDVPVRHRQPISSLDSDLSETNPHPLVRIRFFLRFSPVSKTNGAPGGTPCSCSIRRRFGVGILSRAPSRAPPAATFSAMPCSCGRRPW